MKPSEVLTDESKWIKGQFGRDANGYPVSISEVSEAVCFCSRGAIRYALGAEKAPAFGLALKVIVGQPVINWNDDPERTFEDVRAALLAVEAKLDAEGFQW